LTQSGQHAIDSRLRILVVVHGFPPDTWAGTEVYALELATALARRGHTLTIVARTPARDSEAEWNVARGTFRDLPVLRVARRIDNLGVRDTYLPAGAREVFERILDEERPDVVHVQHLLHLSVAWLDVLRERGIPSVITYNDYWVVCARVQMQRTDGRSCASNRGHGCIVCITGHRPALIPAAQRVLPLFEPVVRRLLGRMGRRRRLGRMVRNWIDTMDRHSEILERCGRADLGIAPSRFLRAKLLDSGYFDPARLEHSIYGMRVPSSIPAKNPRPAGVALRVGFIGSILTYKGVEVLVRAMQLLRERPIELVIHGDHRPREDEFHARVTEIALATRTHFAGRFDNARISEIHADLDVLVVPSTWYENSPLTIHEAFLHGTPVVTSDYGGMRENVRHEVDGLHFQVGDERSLADALDRLARDHELLTRLARGVPAVKSIEVDAVETEARYRKLLAARAASPDRQGPRSPSDRGASTP